MKSKLEDTSKAILRKIFLRSAIDRFLNTPFNWVESNNFDRISFSLLDIVTIAFNNSEVIELQYRLLKQHLKGVYCYIVADNSSNINESAKISEFCATQCIAYLKLPKNSIWKYSGSHSHGATMNWMLRNVITPRKSKFFGFIDHDIFPVYSTDIVCYLNKQDFYGLLQERESYWYLWSGFCFFRKECYEKTKLNFLPIPGLDTGGGNYPHLYAHYKKSELDFPPQTYEQLIPEGNLHDTVVEHIGEWVHTFIGSNWRNSPIAEKKWEIFLSRLQTGN
jgi:hypothetical protein